MQVKMFFVYNVMHMNTDVGVLVDALATLELGDSLSPRLFQFVTVSRRRIQATDM